LQESFFVKNLAFAIDGGFYLVVKCTCFPPERGGWFKHNPKNICICIT